jgi:hypothetical protein
MNASDKKQATGQLLHSLQRRPTRRGFLAGATAGATGLTMAGATMLTHRPTFATSTSTGMTHGVNSDTIVSILTVARTAEQLAVTFYTNGIANADKLGISGQALDALKAALIEEQIHQKFFTAHGGASLADTFSFPSGAKTFTDLSTFIATQQQLEGVFDSAFLVAIMEFGMLGRLDLSQIAGQIATVEAEHRALGRMIGGLTPANNWAYSPVLLGSVGDAPALVQKAGYLSPMAGNSYKYQEVSTSDGGVTQTVPYAVPSTVGGLG